MLDIYIGIGYAKSSATTLLLLRVFWVIFEKVLSHKLNRIMGSENVSIYYLSFESSVRA